MGSISATGAKTTSRLPKEGTTIGTWNVRSLHACGKVQELTHGFKRHRLDILSLAKVRWTGFGETTTDERLKIWHCGEDSKHQYWVEFIVQIEVVGSIVSCTPISCTLISIRISARPHVIHVYAPTSDNEDDEVDQFSKQLDNIIAKTPKKDIPVVQDDLNAKVGPDTYNTGQGQ